jgi:Fe2+ or Zn2+ uptake regulation protein
MAQPQVLTEPEAKARTASWLEHLADKGYRITGSRRAVVDVLAEAEQSLTPADIYEQGRSRHKRLGLVTVYRTLEKLEELGLVQRVHRPDGCHAYIPALQGHEHLLLCEHCGRVEYFRGDDLSDFSKRLEGESGFAIRDHWLQFFGLCSQCK